MRQQGGALHYFQADVSDYQQLRHVVTTIQHRSMPAIKGIFHAAGVLSDGLLLNLGWPEFEKVFHAKVQGSWNLHRLSLELMPELEQFILFSSISSILGSPGQANYAAANSFLDNLAHYRMHTGLPALSINFGPWQQIGMTHNLPQSWLAYGIHNINEKLGLASLERMMSSSGMPQLCLMPNNIAVETPRLPAVYQKLLARLIPISKDKGQHPHVTEKPQQEQQWLSKLKHANSIQRTSLLTELLVGDLRTILRLKEHESLPMDATLLSLGMDSILAAELVRQLQFKLYLDNLSIQSLLFENRSLHELVYLLNEKVSEADAHYPKITTPATTGMAHLLQLSVQQTRIWRHIQAQPDNPAYTVTNFFKLEGPVDETVLERSIQQVIERHPMLRCSFHLSLGLPFQFCHEQVEFRLQYSDLSALAPGAQTQQVTQLMHQISDQPFDFTKAPLLRSILLRCAEQQYVWAVSISHLLTDGASNLILFQDILHQYALHQQFTNEQPVPATPYQDFIDWQLGNLVDGTYERYVAFWDKQLHDYQPPVLPVDKPEPMQALRVGDKEPIHFSGAIFRGLKALALRSQVTLPNLLLTAYGMLLAQFAKEDHAFITMLCAGREAERYQTTIGNIANELPLIIPCAAQMTFIDIAKQVQNNLADAFVYQYLQPEQIAELNLPIPDVSFDFQNLEFRTVDPGFRITPFTMESSRIPLWGVNPRKLSLKLSYNGSLLTGYLKYRIDLYDRETICHLTEQFLQIIKEVIATPERTYGNLADALGAKL